jgi:hypothetical protein
METKFEATVSDELSQLDRQIAAECNPAVLIALQRRRLRVQHELDSERNNPELAAIMRHSAASAVLSIATPLPDGSCRLSGPASALQVATVNTHDACSAAASKTVRPQPLPTQQRLTQIFFGIFFGIFFSPFFWSDSRSALQNVPRDRNSIRSIQKAPVASKLAIGRRRIRPRVVEIRTKRENCLPTRSPRWACSL